MAVKFSGIDSLASLFTYLCVRAGTDVENLLSKDKFLQRFKKLIESDYMSLLINSSTAMQAVINSSTALNVIKDNSSAWTIFINSTALTQRQVPTMTSNTSPEGQASASSVYSSTYEAFKAFDKNTGTSWCSATGASTNQWVRYDFPVNVFVHTVTVRNLTGSGASKDVYIQRSQDGNNWTTVLTTTLSNANSDEQSFSIASTGYARYWRLFIVNGYMAPYVALYELNFKGFQQP